jgi:hypothetical protein
VGPRELEQRLSSEPRRGALEPTDGRSRRGELAACLLPSSTPKECSHARRSGEVDAGVAADPIQGEEVARLVGEPFGRGVILPFERDEGSLGERRKTCRRRPQARREIRRGGERLVGAALVTVEQRRHALEEQRVGAPRAVRRQVG